jgi:hypothetical protein
MTSGAFVLFVLVGFLDQTLMATQEFDSRETCELALAAMKLELTGYAEVKGFCQPK